MFNDTTKKYTIGNNDDLSLFKSNFNAGSGIAESSAEAAAQQPIGQKKFTIGDNTSDLEKFKSKLAEPKIKSQYSDAAESQRLKAASSISASKAQPVKTEPVKEQPQIPYTDQRWQSFKVPEVKSVQQPVQQSQAKLPPNLRKVYEDELRRDADGMSEIADIVAGTRNPMRAQPTTNPRANLRPVVIDNKQATNTNATDATETIEKYRPGALQQIKDFAGDVDEKLKTFLYGVGSAAGGRSLDRLTSDLIEKEINKRAAESGNDTVLKQYKANREFWNEDRQLNAILGRNTELDIDKSNKVAKTIGEIAGEIAKTMSISSAAAPVAGVAKAGSAVSRILPRVLTGALSGAESAYSHGGDAGNIIKEAAKSAGFFAVGGEASNIAGNRLIKVLTPVYEKYPQWGIALKALVAGGQGASMGITGTATSAALSKIFGDETPTINDILKTGLVLAGSEMLLSILTKQPFVPLGGREVGGAKTNFDDSLSAESLTKKGYAEFKPGSGIWINSNDPSDMVREMININGIGVYKSDIVLAERSLGRKLTTDEILKSVDNPNYFKSLRYGSQNPSEPQKYTASDKAKGILSITGDISNKADTNINNIISTAEKGTIIDRKPTDLNAPTAIETNAPIQTVTDEAKIKPESNSEATEGVDAKQAETEPKDDGKSKELTFEEYKALVKPDFVEDEAAWEKKVLAEYNEIVKKEQAGKKVTLKTFGEVEIVDDTDKSLVRVKNKFGTVIPIGRKHFENLLIEEVKPEEVKPEEVKTDVAPVEAKQEEMIEKPVETEKTIDTPAEQRKEFAEEVVATIKPSNEELEKRIEGLNTEIRISENAVRTTTGAERQKELEHLNELRHQKHVLESRIAEIIEKPKSNTDKLQNALINEQLTIDGVEIPKGKKHGFDYGQRYQIANELIEGSKTDKEKITVKVRDDGTINVVNSEPIIAEVLNDLGIKKKEVKIPYKIDKNVVRTIAVDKKNMMATADGIYAGKVTVEEIEALKEFAKTKDYQYRDDLDITNYINAPADIELKDTPKIHKIGRNNVTVYIFKTGETFYTVDKKLFDLFNKDGNRFYVTKSNISPIIVKNVDGEIIGLVLPVKNVVAQETYNNLNPATGKEFFSKAKTKKPVIVEKPKYTPTEDTKKDDTQQDNITKNSENVYDKGKEKVATDRNIKGGDNNVDTNRADTPEDNKGTPSRQNDGRTEGNGKGDTGLSEGELPGKTKQNDQPAKVDTDRGQNKKGDNSRESDRSVSDENTSSEGLQSKPSETSDDTDGNVAGDGQNIEGTTQGTDRRGIEEKPQLQTNNNYRIVDTDSVFTKGGKKTRYKANIDALNTLLKLLEEGRKATSEEQSILAKFSGWGALPEVFDYIGRGASEKPKHEARSKEFYEVKEILEKLSEHIKSSDGLYYSARRSTMNAHFTSPKIISNIYKILDKLGFRHGSILEPSMGIGNFFGLLPESMAGKSRLYGVELDPITGNIARQLYPSADIRIQGYQDTQYPDNFFDVAIGNVPFGDIRIYDKTYKQDFLLSKIHNYFFAKTVDKIKPGGVIAFITSTGTMDAKSSGNFRKYIANRANLIAAIRLPNDTFKENAGTEVTTDLIILQKLQEGELPKNNSWVETGKYELNGNTFSLNQYYIDNPHMMLGELEEDTLYGSGGRLALKNTSEDIQELLNQVIEDNIPKDILKQRSQTQPQLPAEIKEAAEDIKEGSYFKQDGVVYRKKDGEVKSVSSKAKDEISKLIDIKGLAKSVLSMQTNKDIDDATLETERTKLKKAYDSYVKKYGRILRRERKTDNTLSKPLINSLLSGDPELYIYRSLEIEKINDNNEQEIKEALIFTQRTYTPYKPIEKVNNANDGLIACMNDLGYVDIEHIVELYGKSEEEIVDELGDKIYKNPKGSYETADEYLSGNVRKKLKEAEEAATLDRTYIKNVEALRKVQPEIVSIVDVDIKLGESWIPIKYTKKAIASLFDLYRDDRFNLSYSPSDATWSLTINRNMNETVAMKQLDVDGVCSAIDVVRKALNNSSTDVYDEYKDAEGKTVRTLNKDKTLELRQKVEQARNYFKEWAMENAEVANDLERIYNDTFNVFVARDYGEIAKNMKFPNMNPYFQENLYEHQRNAIARAVYGGNTLFAHAVGAGKTFAEIGAVMEYKRLGLAKKPVMVVPNNKLGDYERDFRILYPGANILALNEDDFSGDSIKETLLTAATNDWDCVIIRHSSFTKIPVGTDLQRAFLERQIHEAELALAGDSDNSFNTKRLMKKLDSLREKLKDLLENRATYDMLTFEEIGFDMIVVDEAHEYKNLSVPGKLGNIKGMKVNDADKTFDMLMKLSYVKSLHNNKRGVIFGTGTPISNSMAELFIMTKYLRPDLLEERNIDHFDAWARTFADVGMSIEVAPKGGFRTTERFKAFTNLPEVIKLFREFTDIKMQSDIKLPLPTLEGDKPIIVKCEPHKELSKIMQEVNDNWESAIKDKTVLRLFNMVRLAPLDVRLINPGLKEHKTSKANMTVQNVLKCYKETKKEKGTQIIFLNRGRSNVTGFDLYKDIIDKLVKAGIPKNEIALVQGGMKQEKLDEIFSKANKGEIRVLIGSMGKLGTGVNVQERLFAVHEMDVPYRPSDIEQGEGRMLRQGNKYYDWNKPVRIYRYVTQGIDEAFSGDSYSWQIIEQKRRNINSVMKGDASIRKLTIDDDAEDAALMKAIASGNPLMLDKIKLESDIDKLRVERNSFLKTQLRAKQNLKYVEEDINSTKQWIRFYDRNKDIIEGKHDKLEQELAESGFNGKKESSFEITLKVKNKDVIFDNKNKANEEIKKAISRLRKKQDGTKTLIGKYKGFKIYGIVKDSTVSLIGGDYDETYYITTNEYYDNEYWLGRNFANSSDFLWQIDHTIRFLPKAREKANEKLKNLEKTKTDTLELASKPFAKEDELNKLAEKLKDIDKKLGIGEIDASNETEDDVADTEKTKLKKSKGTKSSAIVQPLTGQKPQIPQGDGSSTLEDTKTVDEIVEIIEKAIGVPIRTGKFRQRTYGIFKVVPEVIRTKVTNDLSVICHEVGHYLDKKFKLDDKQFKNELMALGRPASRASYSDKEVRAEGVAEFVRLYLTNTNKAKNIAPNFYDHFESKLDREALVMLNSIRTDILKVVNLSDVNKIKNDLSVGEARKATKQKTGLLGMLQRAYNAWVDEYAPFARVAKRAKEAGYNSNIDTAVKVYRGLEGKVLGNINMAQTDLNGKVIGKSFNDILKPIKKEQISDFRAYMVARRAIDYHKRNMVMPQPYSVYYDTLITLDNKYPHFADVFNELGEWEDNEMQLLVDSGIMSQQTVDKIKIDNPNHVPLYRIQEAVEAVHGGSGSTLGQSKKVVKKAKGSGKTIIDPIESMIFNAFIIRRAAEANQINSMLADMADSIEGFGDLVEAVPPGMKGFTFNVEEIEKKLKDMWETDTGQELDTTGVDLDKLVTLFRANYRERNNEITVYRNGKPKLYQLETELYKAIKGLNREASHFIIRALNVPKRILQSGAVTTLQFVMRNMARDTSASLIQSEAGINPIDIAKGYISAAKKDKWYKQWVQSGGATEYLQVNQRTQVQGILDDVIGYTLIDKLQDAIKKPTKENLTRLLFTPINTIRDAMEWSEAGPRVAEMRKAIEKGYSTDEAAALSRDLSQDFARAGYRGKELNKITAFFNANVQGIEKQARVFKEHPYRTLFRGLMYVTLPTMFLYFINDDNEKYKQMAAWRKALFYNIPLGNPKTAQRFLSIPKPYGWGFFFGALPETILDGIKNDDPKMWKDIREGFVINFDVPLMPSAFSPLWEIKGNKSWNKTPIESAGDKNKPAYLRYNGKSSMAGKGIANVLKDVPGANKLSPKQIDYVVKGYTGSVGDFFWRLPDTIKKGIELPTDYANYPVVRAFITDTAYSNRTIDDFYTYGEELNMRLAEAKETGTYRAISHLPEDKQKGLVPAIKNATKEYNSVARSFSDGRKAISEIKAEKKYGPAEKKMRERQVQLKMIDIADKFNKKYERFKKQNNIK